MKLKNTTSIRLKEYALLAGSVLAGLDVNGEIVYVNPEPDDTLQFNGDFAYIDLDSDGYDDYLFNLYKHNVVTSYDYNSHYEVQLAVRPQGLADNAVAGSYFVTGSVMYNFHDVYVPYLIPDNYPIDFMISFQDAGFQVMGYFVIDSAGNHEMFKGNWNSEHHDVYLGIRFYAVDHNLHYGWIRCSVIGSLDAFIIHDFAFEGIPEKSIRTGDMTGTATSDIQAINWISVSTNGSELSIQIDQHIQNTVELNIYDLNGRLISNTSHNPGNHQLHLDAPTGTYIVTAITSDKQFTQKIMIN